ncbi:Mss4-like protein [Aspergillus egyptiacus]|nr:Mss4-like protein [Aspergillus egyptiacus]
MTLPTVIAGACYCGQIRYQTTAPVSDLSYCYCRICQLVHGAPFAPFVSVDADHFHWVRKDGLLELNLTPYATRTVCGACRAPLTMSYHARPQTVSVVAVTVREEESAVTMAEIKVQEHIFVGMKPRWFAIPEDGARRDDGLPAELRGCVPDCL